MPASIVTQTISSIEDRRLRLENAQCARLLGIGTNWNSMRIGVRMAFNGLDASVTSPLLAIGVCNGVTNIFGSSTCTNFFGLVTRAVSGMTYDAGPPKFYKSMQIQTASKVGTTLTTAGSVTTAVTGDASSVRSIWIMDITKGSPNYSVSVTVPNGSNSTPQTDYSYTTFIQAMEGTPSSVLTGYLSGLLSDLAFTEVAGSLNALCISWDKTATSFEFSDVAYARLS